MIGLFKIPLISKIALLIKSFKSRVSADGGTFEAESCLKTTLTQLNNANVLQQASLVITPNAVKAGKLDSVIPNNGAGDLDVVRATSATRVNSAGLIETVGNNIARIDYSNGSCPSILVEPQRTNLLRYSEEFENAYWAKSLGTLTPNNTIAPNGTITADLFTKSSNINTVSQISNSNLVYATTGIHTLSVHLKPNVGNVVLLRLDSSGNTANFTFNFTTKTFTNSGVNVISSSYEELKDGWFRLKMTGNVTSTSWNITPCNLYTNPTGDAMWVWGVQLEAGSNATSYIPTTSTVTRNADIISKSGIINLIGQTEGTFYSEIQFFEGGARFNGIELFGNSGNRIYISKDTNDLITTGFQANSMFTTVGSFNSSYNKVKIAIRYKSGNSVVYVNGVNVGSRSAIINFTAALTTLNCNVANNNIYSLQGRLFSCAVFPLGLTNSELQKLTTL